MLNRVRINNKLIVPHYILYFTCRYKKIVFRCLSSLSKQKGASGKLWERVYTNLKTFVFLLHQENGCILNITHGKWILYISVTNFNIKFARLCFQQQSSSARGGWERTTNCVVKTKLRDKPTRRRNNNAWC